MSSPPPAEFDPDTQLLLRLAKDHATDHPNEGPWYGAYGLLLRSLEVIERRHENITATMTFPQHPVSILVSEADDDVYVPDDHDTFSDRTRDSSSPTPTGRPAGVDRPREATLRSSPDPLLMSDLDAGRSVSPSAPSGNVAASPYPPLEVPRTPRHSATEIEERGEGLLGEGLTRGLKRRRTSLSDDPSPPRPALAAPVHTLTSPASTCSSIHDGVQQALQLRATQIPDFLRMVFFITPTRVTERVDLIVENKRNYEDRARYLFSLGYQTYKQAQYVFRHDVNVQVVACIMAIGEKWAYREIARSEADIHLMEEELRNSRGKDTAYSPSPEPTNSSSSFVGAPSSPNFSFPVRQATASEVSLELQEAFPIADSMISIMDNDTPRLLNLIQERLREINPDMWPDH